MPTSYNDLSVLFLNCTLKKTPGQSHTRGLIDISKAIMEKQGVSADVIRPIDLEIATGVYPDMKEYGWDRDAWPGIYESLARMLKDAGGILAHGNQRSEWDAGCRFDHPNPEYR